MAIVDYPLFEDIEVIEPKIYIEDDGISGSVNPALRRIPEWVDFSDKLEAGGVNLLQRLAQISHKSEGHGAVSFQSSLSNVLWYNGDNFWSRPIPPGDGPRYGRSYPSILKTTNGHAAYFTFTRRYTGTVLAGHKIKISINARLKDSSEIETPIAYFYIKKVTRNTQNRTCSMKVTSIAQPLLENNCNVIKDAGGWYRNKPIAFLIRKILEDQYRIPDWNVPDPNTGTLPPTFKIPERIILHTDDWEQETKWRKENPGDSYDGPDPRTLSNYGRPPEWDGSRWREDGSICRAIGLWYVDGTADIDLANPNQLTVSINTLPTDAMGLRIGDNVVIRESQENNDGSYPIIAIPDANTLVVENVFEHAETAVPFSITVMYFGCDDKIWEYNPETELYIEIPDLILGKVEYPVPGGGQISVVHNWRTIELNRNDRFVLIAWSNPPYQQNSDPANWNYAIHSIVRIGMLWRNHSQGMVTRKSNVFNAFPGDLLMRDMQTQVWGERAYAPDGGPINATVFSRQAGKGIDPEDPYYASNPQFLEDNMWNTTVGTSAPTKVWWANRGQNIILPFAQKIWLVTNRKFGLDYHPREVALYQMIYGEQLKRTRTFGHGDNSYYADGKSYVDLDAFLMMSCLTDQMEAEFHVPENTEVGLPSTGMIIGNRNRDLAKILVCQRDFSGDTINERLSSLDDIYTTWGQTYNFSNKIIPPGCWLFKTANATRRHRAASGAKQWDEWGWRLIIAHSWGTKGAIQFVDSTEFPDGIIIYPFRISDDGSELRFARLDGLGAQFVTSSLFHDSWGAFDLVRGSINLHSVEDDWDGEFSTHTLSKTGPYNSYNDDPGGNRYDNNLHQTQSISSCTDDNHDYFYLSLRYGYSTAGPLNRDSSYTAAEPIPLITVDIVKYESSLADPAITLAPPQRLYAGKNDSSIAPLGKIPVDIYFNPDGGIGEELMVIVMNQGSAFGIDYYRIYFHSSSAIDDSLTPVDAMDPLKGTFPNKPSALTYDSTHKQWYGVTAESGSLFCFTVAGPKRYQPITLDMGWQTVIDEGFVNVKTLAIDPVKRRTPDLTPVLTRALLSGYMSFVSYHPIIGYRISPLHSQWATNTSPIWPTFSVNGLNISPIDYKLVTITNSQGDTDWLYYDGLIPTTEFEIVTQIRSFFVTAEETWTNNFDSGLTELSFFKGDFGSFHEDTFWSNPSVRCQSASSGAHRIAKMGDEDHWNIESYVMEKVHISNISSDNPEVHFLIDVKGEQGGSTYRAIGFRLIRRGAAPNWTVEKTIYDSSFTDDEVHEFSGGTDQFDGVDFQLKIEKELVTGTTYQYTFSVWDPISSTWIQTHQENFSGYITGAVAFGASGSTVHFDDAVVGIEGSGSATLNQSGVVYCNGATNDQNRVELDIPANRIRLLINGAIAEEYIPALSLSYETDYFLRIQKNIAGDGQLKVFLDNISSTVPILEQSDTSPDNNQHGPWQNEGMSNFINYHLYQGFMSEYDSESRAIVYGISAPTFDYDWAQGDERIAGKYFFWKYDALYSSRIEFADLSGMSQWKALQELAQVSNHVMGFDLQDFYFVPRVYGDAETVLMRKSPSDHGVANIRTLTVDDGIDEVYNYASITPGRPILEQPSWNVVLQKRTDEEFDESSFDIAIEQKDTREQFVRLICSRPGKLVPEQGINTTPQFSYFISESQFETFTIMRKETNLSPHELYIAESTTGMKNGDIIEISVESDNTEESLLTAEVDSVEDTQEGGHLILKDALRPTTGFPTQGLPIGTSVLIRSKALWSNHLEGTEEIPKFWPWHYDSNGDIEYPALESGRLYQVGLSNLFLRIEDAIYETNVRRWVRILDTPPAEYQDEKLLYVLATRDMMDWRQGDIIEINAPGMKIDTGERLVQSSINLPSKKDYGKRQWPLSTMKFLLAKQAKDLTRRVVRERSWPKGIYSVAIGFNPLIKFLDSSDRLQLFGLQDADEFEYSPSGIRWGYPRGISHDPMNFRTTIELKDKDES